MNPIASLPRVPGYGADQRRPQKIDWYLILASLILLTMGLMSLYSEGATHDGDANFRKQVVNMVIGLGPFAIFALTPPRIWRRGASILYGLNILMLIAVFFIGSHHKGAERWIQVGPIQFQPSDLAKIVTVITLAAFYTRRQDSIHKLSTFALGFLHLAVPMVLILFQPHLGSAMVLFVSWFAISIVAGVPGKYLGAVVICFVALAGLVVVAPKLGLLHGYQLERLTGFFGKSDPKGKGWQTSRAAIALGAGGVAGTGFMKGEQKAGHFIPEQHNDFIITVIGEEGGLIGATMALCAFGFFFFRLWLVMFQATNFNYRLLVGGLFAVLGFHTFVNIAMVLGIVPVVGLWLPFMSSGGTALWLCMSCVGLTLNIRRRERPLLF